MPPKKKVEKTTQFDDFDAMVNGMLTEVTQASDVSTTVDWISSGSIPINIALSGVPSVALPMGRIINLEGESDTGKTLLAQTIMREAQMKYQERFRGLYIDVERGIAMERLEGMGMFTRRKPKDPNKPRPEAPYYEDTTGDPRAGTFRPVRTTDLTSLCEKIIPPFLKAAKENPQYMCVICIDSVSMLMTTHERDSEFETRDLTRSQELRKMMRQLNDGFVDNLMILLVHHQSDVIRTSKWEPINDSRELRKTISGGKSVKYVPDVRIEVSFGGQVKNKSEAITGQTARIKVIKTRLYKPMISAEAVIDHNYGFTRTGGLFDQLIQLGLITKNASGRFICTSIFGDKPFTIETLKDELEKEDNARQVVDMILQHLQTAAYGGDQPLDAPKAEEQAEDAFSGIE